MHLIQLAREYIQHLPAHLNDFAGAHSVGVYVLLMVIVFCETGLVVTPFLPGDSLLFAVGAVAATVNSPINLPLAMALLCLSANCGDILNYSIGLRTGPKIFSRKTWLLNQKHLEEAQRFYQRHGRKTIIIARFVPIIRTFAPFVAGIGQMSFVRFVTFSVAGGIFWVVSVTLAGYFFGRMESVQKHFELVVLGIVAVSLIPVVIQAMKARNSKPVDAAVGVGDEGAQS